MEAKQLAHLPVFKLRGFDFSGYVPRGTVKRLAAKHEMTLGSVSRIKNGKQFNADVIKDLVEIAVRQKSVRVPIDIANGVNSVNSRPVPLNGYKKGTRKEQG